MAQESDAKIGPSGLPLNITTMWMLIDDTARRAVGWTGSQYVIMQGDSETEPVVDKAMIDWIEERLIDIGETPPTRE